MKRLLFAVSLCCAAFSAQAAVHGENVSYQAGDTTLKGYVAYDDAIRGRRPAVLVVHEWWGLNDYARRRADMLAKQGYTALAVDMFGDGRQANHPDDAGKFATEVSSNMPLARARFEAGMKLLQSRKEVDPDRIAAFGYCFGGGVVLNMARAGLDLKGVATFHGALGTDIPAGQDRVRARILVFTGENDAMITPDKVAAFRQEMDAAGADYRIVTYPGAQHSFTNPDADEFGRKFNLPLAYNAAADKDSWRQAMAFLRVVFGSK